MEDADIIAVSPVYKATGGGHRHGLVVEHQVRPLLGFSSAMTVPTSVYASDRGFRDGVPSDPTVKERIDLAGAQLATLLLSRVLVRPAGNLGTTVDRVDLPDPNVPGRKDRETSTAARSTLMSAAGRRRLGTNMLATRD